MFLFDIHTHNIESGSKTAILDSPDYIPERIISLGIHPWNIDNGWKKSFHSIEKLATNSNVVAIGECGLDSLRSTATAETQEEVFIAHARLAEEYRKPLIIHCVKAFDRLIALRKSIAPQQPWIIHGFRGKPQLAAQLIKAGFYISLGEHFNRESAKSIPADRLFIESDESRLPIADIYAAVAAARDITTEELARLTETNARIFGQFYAHLHVNGIRSLCLYTIIKYFSLHLSKLLPVNKRWTS